MSSRFRENTHIVILGAGVIGLSIAFHLREAGAKVTIVAKDFPGDEAWDYASPWFVILAGAHWRTHADFTDERQLKWDAVTYDFWMRLVKMEEKENIPHVDRSGVAMLPSLQLWTHGRQFYSTKEIEHALFFRRFVRDFHMVGFSSSPIPGAMGATFTSLAINVPRYLSWLLRGAVAQGVVLIRDTLHVESGLQSVLTHAASLALSTPGDENSMVEVESPHTISAFVNAMGLAARDLCRDKNVYPVRGQTVLLKGEASQISTLQSKDPQTGEKIISYVIPRPGGGTTILGGTSEKKDCNTTPDPEVTEAILRRCANLAPELYREKGTRVISSQVGLRPARKGGARVEFEKLESNLNGRMSEWNIVHAYGVGGAGYQNSIGVAQNVVQILKDHLLSDTSGAKL